MKSLQEMMSISAFWGYSYSYPHKTSYGYFEEPLNMKELWRNEKKDSLFLYFHIPFCETRCGFCNLFSIPKPENSAVSSYIDALERQAESIDNSLKKYNFTAMAIGGGTPNYLDVKQLERIFSLAKNNLNADPNKIPVSVEISPHNKYHDRIYCLHENNTDRISIGIQSFIPDHMNRLKRNQSPEILKSMLELIRDLSFPQFNIDLIYGIPEQKKEDLKKSIELSIEYGATEIYLYPLYIRPGTFLESEGLTVNKHYSELYRFGRDTLKNLGFHQSSMRHFHKGLNIPPCSDSGYACQRDGMIGMGCGARSYTGSYHYSFPYAIKRSSTLEIIENFNRLNNFIDVNYGIKISPDDRRRRFIIKSVLLTEGLKRSLYHEEWGTDVLEDYPQLSQLEELKLAAINSSSITLNEKGIEYSDTIGPWLYSEKIKSLVRKFQWQ